MEKVSTLVLTEYQVLNALAGSGKPTQCAEGAARSSLSSCPKLTSRALLTSQSAVGIYRRDTDSRPAKHYSQRRCRPAFLRRNDRKRVDVALYEAKASGHKQVIVS